MKRIRVSGPAERGLDGMWYYIATKSGSIQIANGVIDSIAGAFVRFARVPEAGTRRDQIETGLRGFPVANYIVFYREIGRHVVISRVIHGTRDRKPAYGGE